MELVRFIDSIEDIYSTACEVVAKVSKKGTLILITLGSTLFVEAHNGIVDVIEGDEIKFQSRVIYQNDWQSLQTNIDTLDFSSQTDNSFLEDIEKITDLRDNWDGDGSKAPVNETISNTKKIYQLLVDNGYTTPQCGNTYATSYGSIVMDLFTPKGLLSLEIGSKELGFYTDYEDGENYSLQATKSNFDELHIALVEALS